MTALPRKRSKLIRLAVADFRKVLRSPVYEIYMGTWHSTYKTMMGQTRCEVCLAGAVMAKSLGVPPDQDASPGKYKEGRRGKLFALDRLRDGELARFYRVAGGLPQHGKVPVWLLVLERRMRHDIESACETKNWDKFCRLLLAVARELERHGR